MNYLEMIDPDGEGLALTVSDAGVWITCVNAEGHDVTVGPFPTRQLHDALGSPLDALAA